MITTNYKICTYLHVLHYSLLSPTLVAPTFLSRSPVTTHFLSQFCNPVWTFDRHLQKVKENAQHHMHEKPQD